MEYINATVMGKNMNVKRGTTYFELSKLFSESFESPVMVAKNGNVLRELSYEVDNGDDITFCDMSDPEGMRIYVRGVCFIMVKSVKDVLGIDTKVVIEHSIKKNYYCEIHKEGITINQEILDAIYKRMIELVNADLPIIKKAYNRRMAVKMIEKCGLSDKARLFKYRRSSNINLYCLDNFYDYFYGYMPPSTGLLKLFALKPYENGFIIQFPTKESPNSIPEFVNLEKISKVFMEQLEWCRLMGVKDVADLNDTIVNGSFWELVRINEALHEKKIAQIADMICSRINDVKFVLIAGPSSSGKTTFAQRLCVQLRVNGIHPHVIGLDDYFINRDETPVDEFGKHDFESIYALDLKQFNNDLSELIEGKTVQIPTYNFVTGMREYKGNYKKLNDGDIFIIEGIHGLNDKLTESIKNENKFKIFISAMTQLNVDDHNNVSTSDSRLIRRLVRDYNFRGNDAEATLEAWDYVTKGEAKNIFPYQENADVMFNSATIYELSILKQYAEPLLLKIDSSKSQYPTAKRLTKFLDYFLGIDSAALPTNSIIREFVGGSVFHV